MKIVIIGATGLIGRNVASRLKRDHEVIEVGHGGGDPRVDIASPDSIAGLLEDLGGFDALVSCAGQASFGALKDLTADDFELGLRNKLMGQVNLVRLGLPHVADGGSFTLTSGVLAREPIPGSAAISLVNAAVEGFVRAAALEAERGVRVNVVSPVFATETLKAMGMDAAGGMPAAGFVPAYVESVEGRGSGEVLDVREFAG